MEPVGLRLGRFFAGGTADTFRRHSVDKRKLAAFTSSGVVLADPPGLEGVPRV
jgi:hypothetical protein